MFTFVKLSSYIYKEFYNCLGNPSIKINQITIMEILYNNAKIISNYRAYNKDRTKCLLYYNYYIDYRIYIDEVIEVRISLYKSSELISNIYVLSFNFFTGRLSSISHNNNIYDINKLGYAINITDRKQIINNIKHMRYNNINS